jgi:major membrane immunogen (membrane-anchored lipoprotein)
MKKGLLILVITVSVVLTGCGNRQIIDTKWNFSKAKITIGNEIIEVNVKSWKDYDNGDTSIQVVADDGTVYLTDKKNVLLIGK